MKIVLFQAALWGLLFLTSPGQAQYAPLNQTGNPSYPVQQYAGQQAPGQIGSNPFYQAPRPTAATPAPNWGHSEADSPTTVPAAPTTSASRSQYPLIPPANSGMNEARQPSYPQVDRNSIQQPQLYAAPNAQGYGAQGYNTQGYNTQGYNTQGYRTQGIPRVFTQSGNLPSSGQPGLQRVANSYGYPGSGAPNVYGYRQAAPLQDKTPTPSNLPIPGNNVAPQNLVPNLGNVEQLAQPVQQPGLAQPVPSPQAYPLQQNMAPQQNYQQPMAGGMAYDPSYVGPGVVGGYEAGFGMGCGNECCGNSCYDHRVRLRAPGCCRPGIWFGSLGGLVFDRDYEDDHVFGYPLGLPLTNSLVSTQADTGTMTGFEASIGYRFCSGFGVEAVYWGLFAEDGVAAATSGNPQNNWATANYLDYNVSTLDVYMNNAAAFRIRRTNEFHNVELNFFCQKFVGGNDCCGGGCCGGGCCGSEMGYGGHGGFGAGYDSGYGGGYAEMGCCEPVDCCRRRCGLCSRPFRFDLLAGVRFFRFDENFIFEISTNGDYLPNINDFQYEIDVENNLVGLQFGGNIDFCLCRRWSLVGGTRFGVYGNSITHRQRIYGLAGYASTNNGVYAGQDYNLSSTKTDVAFLGQMDLGLRYAIGCRWSLGFGYRLIAVNGVALAPEQIPYDYSHYQEANAIKSNSGLILHGAYLRVGYNF